VLYILAVTVSLWSSWIAQAIYVFVALLWLVPDRRIERALRQSET
jgi:chromatin segregation and condensation protein Rec8/ScpA/Scc1 (kleisin family)